MNNIISVIIPVYNAESYLPPMLTCLKNQTYKELELIFINDGSTDNSQLILDNAKKLDDRIVVHTQKNSGVSAARNNGLEISTGDYIAYLDADDCIKEDYFEKLISCMIDKDADIVCCDFTERKLDKFNNEIEVRLYQNQEGFIHAIDEFIEDDRISLYSTVVWAKLFKREIAFKARFEPIRYGEDSKYMAKIFITRPKIYLLSYVGYEYIRWQESATKNKKINNREIEVNETWLDILQNFYYPYAVEKNLPKINYLYMITAYQYLISLLKYNNKEKYFKYRKNTFFIKISKKKGNTFLMRRILRIVLINCYKYFPYLLWITYRFLKRTKDLIRKITPAEN